MTDGNWYTLAGIVVTAFLTYLGVRATTRSNLKSAAAAAEQGAYLRAKELWESGREELERQLVDVRQRVTSLEEQLGKTKSELALTKEELSHTQSALEIAMHEQADGSRRYLAAVRWIVLVVRQQETPRDGEPTRHLPDLPDELRRDVDRFAD